MTSTRRALVAFAVVCAAVLATAGEAQAQYKNMSWGLYGGAGFWLPSENTTFYTEGGATAAAPKGVPYSMINPMLHLEVNFKVSNDFTWWFKSGLSFGFVRVLGDPNPALADPSTGLTPQGGIALYLEVTAGPRVYFATDNIRPYLEIGARVPIPGLIIFSNSNEAIAQNVKTFPGLYASFGFEFFVARDVALSIVGGYTRFILFNYPGFNSIDAKFGALFYM